MASPHSRAQAQVPTSPVASPRAAPAAAPPAFDEAEFEGSNQAENVKVFVRVRPLIQRENALDAMLQTPDRRSVVVNTGEESIRCQYDAVLPPETTQLQVYEHFKECVAAVLQGFNATVFAYGQTGSGKTHTMLGPDGNVTLTNGTVNNDSGVIPRAVKDVFRGIQASGQREDFAVYASFVQIYNEGIYDLLRDPSRANKLAIHEDSTQGIFVEDLSEYSVRSTRDTLSLLALGDQNRALRQTHMNEHSSRSHSVFQLLVEQRNAAGNLVRAKLNLVDLAGSEKWKLSQDMESGHISELTNINLSLHTLGRCIAALAKDATHIPYRDSKLTRLLQDSLGGNTKTRVIATLSPAADCIDETISTLKFADRAAQVMVTVRVNEQAPVDRAYVEKLQREVASLRAQLARGGGGQPGQQTGGDPEHVRFLEEELVREREANAALRAQVKQLGGTVAERPTIGASDSYAHAGFLPAVPSAAPPPAPAPAAAPAISPELPGQLKRQNDRLAAALQSVSQAAAEFFNFAIEEDGLRERLAAAVAEGKAAQDESMRLFKTAPSPRAAGASAAAAAPVRLPRAPRRSAGAGGSSAGAVAAGFRVRRKGGRQVMEQPDSDDEERALKRELKEAKAKMRKQLKLQEWLKQKEERELAALQQHEDYIKQQADEHAAREAKFRKRAAATKKRVQDYRRKLRDEAIAECVDELPSSA